MTIMDAISKTDSLFFNTFCYGDKVALLSKLDWMIQRNLIDTHQGGSLDFHGYDADTDAATQLLAPPPYDQMYLTWLQAQMELWLKETDNYNASILTFNAEYSAFENYYNRNHLPLCHGKRFHL